MVNSANSMGKLEKYCANLHFYKGSKEAVGWQQGIFSPPSVLRLD